MVISIAVVIQALLAVFRGMTFRLVTHLTLAALARELVVVVWDVVQQDTRAVLSPALQRDPARSSCHGNNKYRSWQQYPILRLPVFGKQM